MATTENLYTGDGSTVLFSFTFPYIEATDVKASLDDVDTTAYSLANATTVEFVTAPASGVAIRLYRQTNANTVSAEFFPGSSIRAQDLNANFEQNLYVVQEATSNVSDANTNSTEALEKAEQAIVTADSAAVDATDAKTTATSAQASASAAATSAAASATSAANSETVANAADAKADTAISDSASAVTDASAAVSTANSASSTANSAVTTANSAVTTANSAASDASSAVSTATDAENTADDANNTAISANTTANAADTKADTAIATANAAADAVADSLLFTIVANVAAIPSSPSNEDAIQVTNSTGIESFTPITAVPSGFVGDSGLNVKIIYRSVNTTWEYLSYAPNDPDDRYVEKIDNDLQGVTDNGDFTTNTIKVGGTTSAPNVELASSGDITAVREIKVEGSNTPAGEWSGISRFGSLLIGTTSEAIGDAKVSIDSGNGAITTDGNIFSADDPGSSGNPTGIALRGSIGRIQASAAAGSLIYQGYTTGTSTATFQVFGNGSAEFDGDIKSAGTIWGGTTDGGSTATTSFASRLYNDSAFPTLYAKNSGNGGLWQGVNSSGTETSKIDSDGSITTSGVVKVTTNDSPVFQGFDSGDTANPTINMAANGSASFVSVDTSGDITAEGTIEAEGVEIEGNGRQLNESPLIINNTNVDGYNIYSQSNGTGSFSVTASGSVYIGDNSAASISLLDNGNITTDGTIISGVDPRSGSEGVYINPNGEISATRPSVNNVIAIRAQGSASTTAAIRGDGRIELKELEFPDGTIQTTAAGGGPSIIAWANLNSSNSVLGSSGFSSITNVSSGIFTATFSSALNNSNYAVSGTVQQDDYMVSQPQNSAQGSSSFNYRLGSSGNHGNFNHSIMVARG